ncbi:hypothetical protein [Rubritalea tangerina]
MRLFVDKSMDYTMWHGDCRGKGKEMCYRKKGWHTQINNNIYHYG